jgi:UDP-glucose:(heptosyl)LPS alpha-1,3-glucosyltransferase
LVALEALACGLPVITTQYNGASELLTPPTNGIVVQNPHDAAELGGAIEKMLDTDYRKAASVAAVEAANRWTFEMHYQALVDVFREVAAKKKAG